MVYPAAVVSVGWFSVRRTTAIAFLLFCRVTGN